MFFIILASVTLLLASLMGIIYISPLVWMALFAILIAIVVFQDKEN